MLNALSGLYGNIFTLNKLNPPESAEATLPLAVFHTKLKSHFSAAEGGRDGEKRRKNLISNALFPPGYFFLSPRIVRGRLANVRCRRHVHLSSQFFIADRIIIIFSRRRSIVFFQGRTNDEKISPQLRSFSLKLLLPSVRKGCQTSWWRVP